VLIFLASMAWANQAHAHGAVAYPVSRQYQCYKEGGFWYPADGSGIPNAGCRAGFQAVSDNQVYPYQQWNEVSANPADYHSMDSIKKAVPDGLLCAGGDQKKKGLDVPQSAGWHKTSVKAGQSIEMIWDATAPHNPSYLTVYITKPGWSPAKPLRWDDLVRIYRENAPQPVPGGTVRQYKYRIPMPSGRTGSAMLYSIWQREDAGREGFYNCSDISFGGDSFPWTEERAFVTSGFAPKVGDSVRFRVLDSKARGGSEVVDVKLPIDQQNVQPKAWSKELASKLASEHSDKVKIGKRSGDQIVYEPENIFENAVWLVGDHYSSSMSILAGEDGSDSHPPVAVISGAPDSVVAGKQISVSGSSSTGKGLTYQWTLDHFSPASAKTPTVTATANNVSSQQMGTITLKVTDGKDSASTSKQVAILPRDSNDDGTIQSWKASDVDTYKAGTVVKGLDGNLWVCRPFPYEGWCRIKPNAPDNSWPYAAGSAASLQLPKDHQAWEKK